MVDYTLALLHLQLLLSPQPYCCPSPAAIPTMSHWPYSTSSPCYRPSPSAAQVLLPSQLCHTGPTTPPVPATTPSLLLPKSCCHPNYVKLALLHLQSLLPPQPYCCPSTTTAPAGQAHCYNSGSILALKRPLLLLQPLLLPLCRRPGPEVATNAAPALLLLPVLAQPYCAQALLLPHPHHTVTPAPALLLPQCPSPTLPLHYPSLSPALHQP